MVTGASNQEIADQLVITEGTVKSHVKHILRKYGAANRAQAIAWALTES
nr:helix-turn-helix transcriptional regulator [Mycolicibacterium sp. CBMA 360]